MEATAPSSLSREQVDKAFLGLYQDQQIKGHMGITTTLMLLQAHITQQAQELEWAKLSSKAWMKQAREDQDKLAAMTKERDDLNGAFTSGIRHRQEYIELVVELAASQASYDRVRDQWAAAQIRVTELEKQLGAMTRERDAYKSAMTEEMAENVPDYNRAIDKSRKLLTQLEAQQS